MECMVRHGRDMLSDLTITPVTSKSDRKAFVDLPFRLYKDDPNGCRR